MDREANIVTATYIRGNGLIATDAVGGRKYYNFNGHGDTVQLIDSNGQVLWTYDHDAFGNEKPIAGQDPAIDTNPFRYSGEYFDKETGYIYLRARYYAPDSGRFISKDSWSFNILDLYNTAEGRAEMKITNISRILVLMFVAISILTVFIVLVIKLKKNEMEKLRDINIQYIGKSYMDVSDYDYAQKYRKDYMWYYQSQNQSEYDRLQEKFELDDLDFSDYDNKYLIIALGRKLKKLNFRYSDKFKEQPNYTFIPTFDFTEQYEKNAAYIYIMDEIPMAQPEIFDGYFQMYIKFKLDIFDLDTGELLPREEWKEAVE